MLRALHSATFKNALKRTPCRFTYKNALKRTPCRFAYIPLCTGCFVPMTEEFKQAVWDQGIEVFEPRQHFFYKMATGEGSDLEKVYRSEIVISTRPVFARFGVDGFVAAD